MMEKAKAIFVMKWIESETGLNRKLEIFDLQEVGADFHEVYRLRENLINLLTWENR